MEGAMGQIFDLEQPRTERMPIHPAHKQAGYSYLLHRRHEDDYSPDEAGPRSGAAGILICGEHTGTHIDALCHQSDALTLCGGVPVEEVQSPRGFTTARRRGDTANSSPRRPPRRGRERRRRIPRARPRR